MKSNENIKVKRISCLRVMLNFLIFDVGLATQISCIAKTCELHRTHIIIYYKNSQNHKQSITYGFGQMLIDKKSKINRILSTND